MFISFLCMFQVITCPSSRETTVFMRHFLLVILHGWLSGPDSYPYRINKYSCFLWWWACSRSKHLEKRNKHTKKICAPSWPYLQEANLCLLLFDTPPILATIVRTPHKICCESIFCRSTLSYFCWILML